MDHHRQFHHHLNNHPHPSRHLINSSPPSRYVTLRPPPPLPPPFPDDHYHPNLFPPPPQRQLPPPHHHHHHPLPPPCVLHRPPPPPHQNTVTFVASPPPPHHHHQHHHQQQQHRRVEVRRSPPRVIFPPNPHHLHNHNVNHNYNVVDQNPRFRFNDLPPPNSRVSPPNFMPSDRFREDFNLEPPRVRVPLHHHHQEGPEFGPLYRSDRILDDRSAVGPVDRLEGAFDRNLDRRSLGVVDRLEGDFDRDHRNLGVLERLEGDFQHRSLGVVDRLEGDFVRDHRDLGVERLEGDFDHRSLGVGDRFEDRVRDCDHHERYHPEMVMREKFELNSGDNECFRGGLVDDEVFVRGGRDNVGLEENIKMRRSSGGGSREVSRSPIKFRVGGMEVDDDFNNRARNEEIKDYSSHGTPRKSVQKKSAFLRIQPAKQQQHSSFRNRFDNTTSSSSPHKGKESNFESVDSRISEERVGSPVELDLSFKSNALVAKAISAAPSCSDASFSEDNTLSGSGISLDSERPSRIVRFKINSSISKKGVKDSNNRVRVSPMKRLGNLNKGQVCVNHSESSPSVSRNSNSPKSSSNSEVSKKDDRNADFEKVSSPAARKKRKVITSLSRLSSVATSKVDSELVDLDSLANHPADGSMPSDTHGKKLEKELSCSGNNIGSAQNENLDMGKIDVNKSSTVVDQTEVVGQCVAVEFDSKKTREKDILHPLSDYAGSFGVSASEGHGNTEVYLQGEQRMSNLDGEETKFVEKYSSEIFTEKHVEGQDMPFVLVNNGSVEGSSNSMAAFVEDHVENNGICCESAEASDPIAVMSSIINPVNVSNKREDEADLTCRVVHFDMAGPSLPEVATVGLSLDIDNEPALRHTEANGKVGSASIDISSDKGGASLSYDGDGGTFSSRSIDPSDVRVTDEFQEQQCQGSETTSDDVKSRLRRGKSPKTCIYARENSSEFNRKRKAETEPNSLDLRISDSCHDSAPSVSCPIENAMLPVEKFIPEVSGSPCVESHVSHGNELTESSVKHVNTMGSICDLDPIDILSSGGKKRKTLSMESIISDALGSQSSEFIPLADGVSVKCSSQLAEGFTLPKPAVVEEEIGGATSSLCALFSSNANDSKSDNLCKDSCLSIIESAHPDGKQPSVSEHGCNQIIDRNLMMAGANDENGYIVLESECTESVNDTGGCFRCLPADSTRDEDQGSSPVDMECDDTIAQNVNLFSVSDCPQSCASSIYGVVTTNSDMLNTPSNVEFLDRSHPFPTVDVSNADPAIQACSDEKQSMDDKKLNKPLSIQCSATSKVNLLRESQKSVKPGISATSGIQLFTQKSVSLQSKHVKTAPISNFMNRTRRNVLTRSGTSLSTSHQSTVINPSNKTPAYPAKPRTWHRANNLVASNSTVKKPSMGTVPPHRPPYGKALKVQDTSYIRKGNSLVRNPASGAATSESHPLGASINLSKPIVTEQIIKEGASSTIEPSELPDGLVTGACSTPIEMPNTPPLPSSGKTSPSNIACSGEYTPSLPVYKFEGTDNQLVLKPFATSLNSVRDPENVVNRNLEDPGMFSDGDVLGSNSKRLIYVKRKSNQLIAASKSSQLPVCIMDKKVASSSDNNYYKRKKNQLIRASSEGNIHQMLAIVEDSSKSLSQSALHVYPVRNSAKRLSNKGKSSKHSLVWKLGDKGMDALKSGRLLSHLLPWKRATYWSRKLLSSRKRGVVYVRSGRGFSLRRSKVVSLPGTSLKWSKSMEKRSKKVEAEAAMAVTMDSVQKAGPSGVCSKVKSSLLFPKRHVNGSKLHSGERIFRIGAFRYRMDPSRRTLQRISDDELEFTAPKTQTDARKTYVPKRLIIGSDEYVRIGSGNQLVRDPKRRTRILASEKVRWSLHTARMRLAKKRKFCQFFTRFGKCNKGEGKCPFVHDPSKIAVCTKFLNGLCADSNCKLTHKVITERMPDCSFFLQGLCSNEKCPYRHVNVNPKASICESFLRGYCAEGNECRKKHSYICPEFEASGSCPQGSQCKLYHPKKGKAKKKKVQRDQKNSRGRYFGSALSMVVDPETRPVPEKHVEANRNSFAFEGDMGDFISLSDDDEMQDSGVASERTSLFGKDGMTALQLDDLDDLIKPLRILGRVIEK